MTARALVLLLSCQPSTALLAPARRVRFPQALRAISDDATVLFLHGDGASTLYGASSPRPNPAHATVASQLARRVGHFDAKVSGTTDATTGDVVIGLGVTDASKTKATLARLQPSCFVADDECSPDVKELAFCAGWTPGAASLLDKLQKALPFTTKASRARLLAQSELLLARGSSEDALFAALFLVHALVRPCAVVASDINPSWEKGVVRNIQEFKTMADCCGPQIAAALSDPKTKSAIDALNAVDLRDQVGSYRVIVSNETPQLEEFSLCILQQNNCFQSDAPILTEPKVPVQKQWRGRPVDIEAARQIFIGHLADPAAASPKQQPWSWKIVVGANPAYDAFPMQHQARGRRPRPSDFHVEGLTTARTPSTRLTVVRQRRSSTPRKAAMGSGTIPYSASRRCRASWSGPRGIIDACPAAVCRDSGRSPLWTTASSARSTGRPWTRPTT